MSTICPINQSIHPSIITSNLSFFKSVDQCWRQFKVNIYTVYTCITCPSRLWLGQKLHLTPSHLFGKYCLFTPLPFSSHFQKSSRKYLVFMSRDLHNFFYLFQDFSCCKMLTTLSSLLKLHCSQNPWKLLYTDTYVDKYLIVFTLRAK